MTETAILYQGNPSIHLVAPEASLDYLDSRSVDLARPVAPLEAWNMITGSMPWMAWAFRVRDAIAARFGVKRIGGFSGQPREDVKAGDMLDFFLVEHVSETCLTLSERDKHLDVLTCISTDKNRVTITSSVKVHNRFGHAYMVPVGPAHKLIVAYSLAALRKTVAKRVSAT